MRQTRLSLTIAVLLILGLVPGAAGARADERKPAERVAAQLRQLEKDIAAVRGLAFKTPVVARVLPRPKGTDKSLQGYYSIKDKALVVYDDLTGAYERGVLVHEMVHALQDQHFKLDKLHQTSFGGDAELALAALIEGDATFTMIELLKKDQPPVARMLDQPLDKARDVQKAFLYAQGARYVKALKERGGWQAVNAAYKFPPHSTAAILHPGERFSTVDLGPGKTRGELALVRLLAEHRDTAPLALQAAAGWRGDCFVERDGQKSWTLAFATRHGAHRCQEALAAHWSAQDPGWKRLPAGDGATVWQGPKGEVRSVRARDRRVLVLEAPDAAAYKALADRAEGPLTLEVYSARDKRVVTFGELTDRLLAFDLICVGETHDSELNHRVQLEIIKALYARDERLGVGMEMFQRPFQKYLDRYSRGETSEAECLEATEYADRWGYDWSLYRPLVEFCRRNGVPLAALNAPRELTRRISQVGYDKLTDDEKKQLGPIDFHVKEHRDYWYERLAQMHGRADVPKEQKERSYQVMTVWDEYMADSAARFQKERGLRRLVVLAGSGHVERGFGIPARAAKRTGGKAATVRVLIGGDLDKVKADPAADFVVIVR
jgi:uncharacterized iron-regulated protein